MYLQERGVNSQPQCWLASDYSSNYLDHSATEAPDFHMYRVDDYLIEWQKFNYEFYQEKNKINLYNTIFFYLIWPFYQPQETMKGVSCIRK